MNFWTRIWVMGYAQTIIPSVWGTAATAKFPLNSPSKCTTAPLLLTSWTMARTTYRSSRGRGILKLLSSQTAGSYLDYTVPVDPRTQPVGWRWVYNFEGDHWVLVEECFDGYAGHLQMFTDELYFGNRFLKIDLPARHVTEQPEPEVQAPAPRHGCRG